MVDFTLARLIKAPEIDIGQSLHRAAQLRQMETANQIGQFNMREAMEKRGALGDYAQSGNVGSLKAYPDLYGQVQGNEQAAEQAKAIRNARRAQGLMPLEGEALQSGWVNALDDARRAGDLPDLMHRQLVSRPADKRMLQSLIDQAGPIPKELDRAHSDLYRAQAEALRTKPAAGFDLAPDHVRFHPVPDPGAPSGVRYEPIARNPKAAAAAGFKDPKQVADVEEGLRKEFAALAKPYFEMRDAFGRIEQSTKSPSPAGDIALIFNFMKMLDPGSVVREGEFATAQNAAGVPDRIVNVYNRMLKGERLNPNQRQDFVSQSRGLMQRQERQYQGIQKQYSDIAKRTGVNPDNTIVNFSAPDAVPEVRLTPLTPPVKEGATATNPANGRRLIFREGRWQPL